jgi:hypothetical protein
MRASTTDLQLSVVPTTNQKHSARTYHTVSRSNSRNSWLGGRHGRAHMHAHAETQLPKCKDRQGKALHPAASIPSGPERETREQHIPRPIHSGIYAYPCPRSAASYARPPVLSIASAINSHLPHIANIPLRPAREGQGFDRHGFAISCRSALNPRQRSLR